MIGFTPELEREDSGLTFRSAQDKGPALHRAMGNETYFRALAGMALAATLAWGFVLQAQEPPAPPQPSATATGPSREQAQKSVPTPCVEPLPMARWQDYNGKYQKTVGTFARRLERKAVHAPNYKPGAVVCTLELKDKFILFVQSTIDPVTFLAVGFSAGISQAENNDPTFGQGAEGYGKRFGASFADQASGQFFKVFAYPAIFREDPRYYRLAYGSGGKRTLNAVEHAFVARGENGRRMFNFSEWFGTTTTVALSNLYHPGNQRGVAPAARRVGYSVLADVGFDVLREFWPEIARMLKLPFRGQPEPNDRKATSAK